MRLIRFSLTFQLPLLISAFSFAGNENRGTCSGTIGFSSHSIALVKDVDLIARYAHVPHDFAQALVASFFELQHGRALEEALVDCPKGVAALIIHVLPSVEERLGLRVAREFFLLYQKLVALPKPQQQHSVTFLSEESIRIFSGPAWALRSQISSSFPALLGLKRSDVVDDVLEHPMDDLFVERSDSNCKFMSSSNGQASSPADSALQTTEKTTIRKRCALRVYVYETSLTKRPLGCSLGMSAAEVFVHRFFQNFFECRTEDPTLADLFFVPVYSNCMIEQESKLAADMDDIYKMLVQHELRYFGKRGGRDHIFLWSSETYDFPSWTDYIHDSIFLVVETRPLMCTSADLWFWVSKEGWQSTDDFCWHCTSCYQPSKDIVIPSFVSEWAKEHLLNSDAEQRQRSLLVCYRGTDSKQKKIYEFANASVRQHLQELRGSPYTSIGTPFPVLVDYLSELGKCIFCLVPKGLGFWSGRLFDVIFAGCIPVLLSDDVGLPFDDLIDWPSMSVKWPMREAGFSMLQHLARLVASSPQKIADMQVSLRKQRCWFDYSQFTSECSPYRAILRSLEMRWQALPASIGKYWLANTSDQR